MIDKGLPEHLRQTGSIVSAHQRLSTLEAFGNSSVYGEIFFCVML